MLHWIVETKEHSGRFRCLEQLSYYGEADMAKNILIFADGTGQAGGIRPDQCLSNVYKLYRATRIGPDSPIDPAEQVAHYEPGLGTTTDAGLIRLRVVDRLKAVAGSVAGLGISSNVVDSYEAILKHYEPGDRIYLFGFSRGAYTARSVAGVLNLCGVPTHDGTGAPLPRYGRALRAIAEEAVRKVYDHGAGKPRAEYEAEREEQALRFRRKYGSGDERRGDVHPYFIGLFDAVAALGAPTLIRMLLAGALLVAATVLSAIIALLVRTLTAWNLTWPFFVLLAALVLMSGGRYLISTFKCIRDFPQKGKFSWHLARWKSKHYDGYLDPRVNVVRHALAIDETRRDFDRVVWGSTKDHPQRIEGELERLEQYWFAGNHSDIGGSYPEDESRLSDIALYWMVEEARSVLHPILVDDSKLRLYPNIAGPQHCEVQAMLDSFPWWWPKRLRIGWPAKVRPIDPEATLHPSVLRRFELDRVLQCGVRKPYRPDGLRHHRDVAHFYGGQ